VRGGLESRAEQAAFYKARLAYALWLRVGGCRLWAARRRTRPTATTTGVLRRLGACPTDEAARRAVERAVGTEEGALW
jgi:hypothetical protein